MTAVIEDRPAPAPEPEQIDISDLGAVRGWRRNKNVLMTVLMALSAVIILVVLSLVLLMILLMTLVPASTALFKYAR